MEATESDTRVTPRGLHDRESSGGGKQRQEVDFRELGLEVGDRLWGGPYFGVLEYLEKGNTDEEHMNYLNKAARCGTW